MVPFGLACLRVCPFVMILFIGFALVLVFVVILRACEQIDSVRWRGGEVMEDNRGN